MKKALAILLASLIVHPLFLPSLVAAATRFADPGGSGSTCSIGSPCTFNTALSLSTGGDTINMRGGTYPQITDSSGWPSTSAGAILLIQNYNGESVIISENNAPSLSQTQTTTAYTTFRGLTFSLVGNTNEVIGLQGHHLRFENVTATANGPGSGCVVVEINQAAHDNVFSGGDYSLPGTDCYPFYVLGSDNIIEYAKIHDFNFYGIHNFNGSSAVASRNIYRFNEIYTGCTGAHTCSGILLSSGSDNQAYGNAIHGITGINVGQLISGIHLGGGATGAIVYNNTIVDSMYACISWDNSTSGGVVKNNLCNSSGARDFYNSSTGDGNTGPLAAISNNFGDNAGTGIIASGNPLFVNAGSNNYSLQATSPAINLGMTAITGSINACKNGPNPDIGAIQTLANPVVQVNGTVFTITYTNNCTDQILPSAPTGFSFLKNGVTDAISSIARTSANVFSGILANAFVFNNTCNYSYSQSSGNVKSNNNIGNTGATNQEAFTVTNAACTNNTPPGSLNLVKILLGTVGMRMGNGKSVNAGLIP